MTYTAETPHADGSATPGARPRYNLHATSRTHNNHVDGGKTDILSSANCPSTATLQQRCHRTSASARSPSCPTMSGPLLQRAATVWPERIQPPIWNRIFKYRVPRVPVCDGQTSPHRPRLSFSRSTCPPLSPSPHANSFIIGTAVINTHTF